MNEFKNSLYSRWIFANSIAELVGLGSTFAIGYLLFADLAEKPGTGAALFSALAMATSGIIEGVIVGVAQWWAMNKWFTEITKRSWVIATLIGAFVAWLLGALPMTIASLSGAAQQSPPPPEPSQIIISLFAAAMGLVAGLVLAIAQWRVLKKYVHKAWWWLPANSVAWAVGMPIIFFGIDLAQKYNNAFAVLIMSGTLIATGAVVGAIHGRFLLCLISKKI